MHAAETSWTPAAAEAAPDEHAPESLWRSLGYFNLFRLTAATVFLIASAVYRDTNSLFAFDQRLFLVTDVLYWLAAIAFVITHRWRWLRFDWLLTLQVTVDILALTLLLHASGGQRGGIAIMIVVVLAGAGLVGRGRLTMFYAAMATMAVLTEQSYRTLRFGAELGEFIAVGTMSIAFFATAISAWLLAQRVLANEALARQRGIDLNNQMRVNEYIIRDMADGVLVIDPTGAVRQFNPQARKLLGGALALGRPLAQLSPVLANRFGGFQSAGASAIADLGTGAAGASVRARLVRPAEGGDILVYLEDIGRIQAQAQQLKLAALGRLTASIAHEIRNPLAAISHAAELLREEKRGDMQSRLTRIIGDNSRRLDRMVREVLELGRRDHVHAESIALRGYLEAFVEEFCLHERLSRGLFRIEVDGDPVWSFDRAHLHQILWNLLSNAVRYCSREAGAIVLRTSTDAHGRAELHVIDDGPGIAQAHRAQVFEPFYTTHSQGTGLGLYIARELCDANRATLELLTSERGAHFRITWAEAA
jgi:two-component system sensor histidine kinase PilS (NtrC family)